MAHTISCKSLRPGTFVNVYGEIEFSRLTRFPTQEELQRLQQTRQFVPDKPFTTVTLNNAKIIPANPNQFSQEELYVQESFYASSNNPGTHYSIDNKSPNFPRFYQVKVNDDGTIDNTKVSEVPAKAELAKGLKVILILRVFKPKNYQNCGIGLDSVIVQERIRYYGGGDATNHLAAMGITVENELSEAERENASTQATTAPVQENNGMVNPEPVQAPVGNPYASSGQPVAMPAPQPAAAAPAAQTTTDAWTCDCGTVNTGKFCNNCGSAKPVPQPANAPAAADDAWTCPQCGTSSTGKFCNECGTQKPLGGGNPYATPDVIGQAQSTGIRFDPNDTNRNY